MTIFNILKTPPPNITGMTVTAGQNNNIIKWNTNLNDELLTTNIYRNTSNNRGTATLIGNAQLNNSYTDASITPGTTYYYWARTVDKDGDELGSWSSGSSAGISLVARKILTEDINANAVSSLSYASGSSAAFGSWDTYNSIGSNSITLGASNASLQAAYNFAITLYSATSIATDSMYGVTMKLVIRNTTTSTDVFTVETPVIQLSNGTALSTYGPDFNQRYFSGINMYPAGVAGNSYSLTIYLKQTRTNASTVGSVSAGSVNLSLTGVYK